MTKQRSRADAARARKTGATRRASGAAPARALREGSAARKERAASRKTQRCLRTRSRHIHDRQARPLPPQAPLRRDAGAVGQGRAQEAAGRKASSRKADAGAVLCDPGARRAASALRLPARTRRHAEVVGGAQGAESRPVGEAARRACRRSSARIWLVRRRDSAGQLRRGYR